MDILTQILCEQDGCESPAKTRNLCRKHYYRLQRYGSPTGKPAVEPRKFCRVEECPKPMHALGYCSVHYDRFRKHGDPGAAETLRPKLLNNCSVSGCTRKPIAKQLCRMHYHRLQRSGDVGTAELLRPPAPEICIIDGCSKKPCGRGLCPGHYRRWTKQGDDFDRSPIIIQEKHGRERSPEYVSWGSMIQRTTNPNYTYYEYYGGRGIRICERYRSSFLAFYEDVGDRPEDMTLDRNDVNGNYSCGKCEECIENGWTFNLRWATHSSQQRNQRMRKNNTSGYQGAFFNKRSGRWTAKIQGEKSIYIGSFGDVLSAANAYDQFCIQMFGEDAHPNFDYVEVEAQS